MQGHIRVLEKALDLRREEWATFSDPKKWDIEVKFIAHELSAQIPRSVAIGGIAVRLSFESYASLVSNLAIDGAFQDIFSHTVLAPLSEKRTPDKARAKLLELSNSAGQ